MPEHGQPALPDSAERDLDRIEASIAGVVKVFDRLQRAEDATVGLRQRPGDQRLPEPNDRPYVQAQMIERIEVSVEHDPSLAQVADAMIDRLNERLKVGIQRYGIGLQPFNGRDAWIDAIEEAQDLAAYALQGHLEALEIGDNQVAALLLAVHGQAMDMFFIYQRLILERDARREDAEMSMSIANINANLGATQ